MFFDDNYRPRRRCAIRLCFLLSIFVISAFIGNLLYILIVVPPSNSVFDILDDYDDKQDQIQPLIFCFALTSNARQMKSSRALIYSWGKRCDRFFFTTRIQNTSVDLNLIEEFENTSDITPANIVQQTVKVLKHIAQADTISSYQWFLRASDETFVIIPNLRKLVAELHSKRQMDPVAYAGDVERMYEKHGIVSSGSALLLNRQAINRLVNTQVTEYEQYMDEKTHPCSDKMTYDHELVACLREVNVQTNFGNNDLILSQNLSIYKTDPRLKGICCHPNTVAFRASNETDLYKFEFFYHRLKVHA